MEAEAIIRDSAKEIEALLKEAAPKVAELGDHMIRFYSIQYWIMSGLFALGILFVIALAAFIFHYTKNCEEIDKNASRVMSIIFGLALIFGFSAGIGNCLPRAIEPVGSVVYDIVTTHRVN